MTKPYKHVSSFMNAFLNQLPEEQKKQFLIDRRVKQVHERFAACVDSFILDHVNSVYLIKEPKDPDQNEDVSRETRRVLTVYVDNSLVAAELNAQRELVMLKYREQFNEKIDEFVIKISRGPYRDNHPFKDKKQCDVKPASHTLTPEEQEEIERQVSSITDEELRESFRRVLIANKEHPIEK